MKQNVFIIILILLSTLNMNAQYNCMDENIYISMPNPDTYSSRQILEFKDGQINTKNFRMENDTIYSYEIKKNNLIVNGEFNWGKIKCYDDYFELFDKNNSAFQYTKLKTTIIDCNVEELNEIIASSHWKLNLENKNEIIHIIAIEKNEKSKLKYKLVKLNDTYVIFLDDWWNFTICKITKDNIELYGLTKFNNLPEKVNLIRTHI